MSIDAWNIEGIANEVMKAMHVDQAPVENADGYVQKIAYWQFTVVIPEAQEPWPRW